MTPPKITGIEVHQYEYTRNDLGTDYNGFNIVYEPGAQTRAKGCILRLLTDQGLVGEFAGARAPEYSTLSLFAHYLKGRNILERERIYAEVRRALRQYARIGIGPVDIALWDLAGKYHGASISQLLGGYKERLPCYASTYHGDHQQDGLSSPEAYADFARQCRDMGYPGFKIHGWGDAPIAQEVATVHAVGRAVGPRSGGHASAEQQNSEQQSDAQKSVPLSMDLMIDPACEYTTFAEALKVGLACDEQQYYWYEDPYQDGGTSQFAHRKLRQLIKTPLLLTEHVRSLEPHIDFALAEATDFLRGDVAYDGITGVMKLAHAAESLGMDIEFHGPGPAQRQCMAAIRNTNYYELGLVHPVAPASGDFPLYKNYSDALDAIDKDGCVPVPQGTGLGVEIDWDWVAAHRTGVVEY
ncbi:MAG: mandelate racemase [Candidatus Latescibacteria bacterium]|nr:mandelate racemase [Candidatus Latescibacterota bacterium]